MDFIPPFSMEFIFPLTVEFLHKAVLGKQNKNMNCFSFDIALIKMFHLASRDVLTKVDDPCKRMKKPCVLL